MTWTRASLALALVLTAGGCSALSDFDGYEFGSEVDSGVDAGAVDSGVDAGDVDAGPAPSRPTGMIQSSGGATIVTTDVQLTITVGAPQPMGRRSGASENLFLGPGAL